MKLTYKTDYNNTKTVEATFIEPYSDIMLHIETKNNLLLLPTNTIVSIAD